MGNLPQTSVVDTSIKEIKKITCIEPSPVQDIVYVAGTLTSNKARQSCPVLVIEESSLEVKSRVTV